VDKSLIDKLKKASKFETEQDKYFFIDTLDSLATKKDLTDFMSLISCFDDKTLHEDLMYALVHLLESYPDAYYVQQLLENSHEGLKKYPNWYALLVLRVLNDIDCLKFFKKYVPLVEEKDWSKLLYFMKKLSYEHYEIIKSLRPS
jgi:hypothetical protein